MADSGSVTASILAKLGIVEVSGINMAPYAAGDRTTRPRRFDKATNLTSAQVDAAAVFEKALSNGAGVIDMTALTGAFGAAVNADTKAIVAMLLVNTGANLMTIQPGDSLPYPLLASSAGKKDIQPGGYILEYFGATGPVVATASAKNVKITGTGAQVLDVAFIFQTSS
jgi:hypothetical protein